MDDNKPEITVEPEKSLPDPKQISWLLFFDRHPRSDPGMTRQVAAQPNPATGLLVELAMLTRDGSGKLAPSDDPGEQAGRWSERQTIRQHGGVPANRQPFIKAILAIEEV